MSFSLSPHQLVAHWVPGFVFVILVPLLAPDTYNSAFKPVLPAGDTARGILFAVLAFVMGQFLDALRDTLECVWDLWNKVNWDFFMHADAAQIEKLDRWYFTYYVFNSNLVVPLLFFTVGELLADHNVVFLGGLTVTIVLVWDAWSLRCEIAKHTKATQPSLGRT